jgi:DNA-binding CsgD family transcriptional regulator
VGEDTSYAATLGRGTLIADVVQTLLRRRGVVLSAPAGSDLADLAAVIVAAYSTAGGRALRSVDAREASPADVDRLAALLRSGEPVLVRATEGAPGWARLGLLVDDGLADRVDVAPIGPAQLLAVVEGRLGARLDPSAVPVVVPSRPGWNLDLLRDVVLSHRREGRLSMQDGRLAVRGELVVDRAVQSRLVDRLTAGVPESDAGTATLICSVVALVPGVRSSSLLRVLDALTESTSGRSAAEVLESLEESGVLEGRRLPGDVELRLRDGIHAHVLPWAIGAVRRQRLERALLDVLLSSEASGLTDPELISVAKLGLAHARTVATDVLVGAARAALRDASPEAALELARTAVEQGPGFDAEILLAAAELQVGSTAEALDRLRRLVTEARDDIERSAAIALLIQQAVELPSDDGFAVAFDGDSGEMLDDARAGFTLYALGDLVPAADLVAPALPLLRGEALAQGHTIVATSGMLRGRLTRAREHFDLAERTTLELSGDISRILVARANLEAFDGRVRSSIELVGEVRRKAARYGQQAGEAMLGWAMAALLLNSGEVSTAVEELNRSLRILEELGISRTALLVRVDLAISLAICGREEEATTTLDGTRRALADGEGGAPNILTRVIEAEAWLLADEGRIAEASARFVDAADAYRDGGLAMGELIALLEAVRAVPSEAVVDRLAAVRRSIEGELAAVAGDFAAARVAAARAASATAGGPDDSAAEAAAALAATGERAERADFLLIAAEAYAHATASFEAAGRSREAAGTARRRDELTRACGLDRLVLAPAVPSPLPSVRALSVREGEIADLAAAGMSNREISEKLVLSIRTVETHLLRVYQKLGIRRRGELAEALVGAPRATAEDA